MGKTAAGLIDAGYLLEAHKPREQRPSRHDLRPNATGSIPFVRRVMGSDYLRWISQIRR